MRFEKDVDTAPKDNMLRHSFSQSSLAAAMAVDGVIGR